MSDALSEALESLDAYLLAHEADIAFQINDFEALSPIFVCRFFREAQSTDHLGRTVINGKVV